MTAAHCFDDMEQQSGGRLLSTENTTHGLALDVVLGTDDLAAVTTKYALPSPRAGCRVHEGYAREVAQDHARTSP
jgi:hypothetical protein